jgi:hypothetical protein
VDTQTPELEEVIEDAVDQRLEAVFTNQVARIVSFDAKTRSATVQPLVQFANIDEFGDRVVETQPEIKGVPVCFLGGGGDDDVEQTFPVRAGDMAILLHCSPSIGTWKPGTGDIADPRDDVRHQHHDCVALCGLKPFQGRRVLEDGSFWGYRDGGTGIQILDGTLKLGGRDATQAVVVQSALDFFGSALVHALATLALETPSPATVAAILALQSLQTALGTDSVTGHGWDAGTTVTKAM